jgi:hypothetical protein
MKIIPQLLIAHLSLAALLTAAVLTANAQETAPPNPKAAADAAPLHDLHVAIIGDETGTELQLKHGINDITMDDIKPLLYGILNTGKRAQLLCTIVDEDASDNVPVRLDLLPYSGGTPPVPPSTQLSTRELVESVKSYRLARTRWQNGIAEYTEKLQTATDGFIREFQLTQIQTAERFDNIADDLVRRGLSPNFNRSDINGTFLGIAGHMGPAKQRVIIINSDCEDRPMKAKPRVKAFTSEELAADIFIIFVNTSHGPDQCPLFNGLTNPRAHADSMRQAVEMVTKLLSESTASTASTPAAATPAAKP